MLFQAKLEQAVQQANNFHGDLNNFIAWLTDTEKILNNMKPVSRVMEHVTEQIKDQKVTNTTVKQLKILTHEKFAVILLKFEQRGFTIEKCVQKT